MPAQPGSPTLQAAIKDLACTDTPSDQNTGRHARKRSRDGCTESSLGRLLEQIKRLKLPTIDREFANRMLAPFVREALNQVDTNGTLLGIIRLHGWDTSGFVGSVDLFSLSTAVQKYRYERLQELGSGSYAWVYKARNRETDEVIAMKKMRFGFNDQGLPSSTLREIALLKDLRHENIVELKDVIYGFGSSDIYVVLECLDCDLREYLDRHHGNLPLATIKSTIYQTLRAVAHAHANCVMHRDLKPQNILVDTASRRIKVADFGLARTYLPPCKAYSTEVVTLWYRAPELLLGSRTYSAVIDTWSIGCIAAELLTGSPLFRAESEIGLLHKMFAVCGTPHEACWPGVSGLAHWRANFPQWAPADWAQVVPRLAGDHAGVSLLSGLLTYAPEARLTAACALGHPWFDDVPEAIADRTAAAAGVGAGPCLDLAPASLLVARP